MLLLAILPLPIGYYTFLRFITFSTFAIAAYIAHKNGKEDLPIYYGLIALLFNPIFPIYHAKEVWIVFDLISAFLLYKTAKHITAADPVDESNQSDHNENR